MVIILIKVVIFDIGGVTIKYPMHHVYRALEKKFKIDRKKIREKDLELDPVIETNKISLKEYWSRFAEGLGVDTSLFRKEYIKAFVDTAILNKSVAKIIERVKKKYRVATISNTMNLHEKIHRSKGHYKFFSRVFLSNKLGMRKPHREIYLYAIEKLNIKPPECVFIDDKQENVEGARKVGMKAILFKNVGQLEKDLKKYL